MQKANSLICITLLTFLKKLIQYYSFNCDEENIVDRNLIGCGGWTGDQ